MTSLWKGLRPYIHMMSGLAPPQIVCYNEAMSDNMNRIQDLRRQVQEVLVRL